MSGTTISSSYVTGIALTDAGADNPVTILAGITISDPSHRAIYASGTIDWTISNYGSLISLGTSAHSYGIAFVGGTITNTAGALISGGYGGVVSYTAGTVINHGSIASSVTTAGAGIALVGGGEVANGVGGVVNGAETGIGLQQIGAVSNSGSVLGHHGSGVLLGAGGAVANNAGGTIIGYRTGVSLSATGTVVNQGSISQTETVGYGYYVDQNTSLTTLFDAGVLVVSGGVSNGTAGVITSYFFGIAADNTISVVNQGQITASSTTIGFGVFMLYGGSATNTVPGTIFGAYDGVLMVGGHPGTMLNQGSIGAGKRAGVDFFSSGAYVSNAASGTITGRLGVLMNSTGQVVNDGSIAGGQYGVDLVGAGTVTNTNSAHISATTGVLEKAGGSVVNQGTIGVAGAAAKGIYLNAAGSVTNAVTGTISSAGSATVVTSGSLTKTLTGAGILVASGYGTVMNFGSVVSTETAGGSGIRLSAGGLVSNASTGTIDSGSLGVLVTTGVGTVVNSGQIVAAESVGNGGIFLTAGGTASNAATGSITAGTGIYVADGVGTVTNYGHIVSTERLGGAGIELKDGGTVINAAGANIYTQLFGVQIYGNGTVVNRGTITANDSLAGYGAGVWVRGLADVSNASGGTISGGLFGVVFYQDSDLINSGAILATATAVIGKAGYSLDVVVTPGATFAGQVDGANALTSSIASALDLDTGSGIGTITGFGSKYVDFKSLGVEDGASWSVAGYFQAAQTIDFIGAGVLTLTNPGSMAGVVDGFSAHDTIVLAGVTGVSAATLDGGNLLTVERASGPDLTFQFDPVQNFSGTNFNFVGVGGNTDLTVPCFAAGTHIATPLGEVAVERLGVGDSVLTRTGARRAIVWLGHRRIDCLRHPRPQEVWPVRVCAGAFGAEMPHRDLLLSPDHAVFVDGVLVPVRYLINDASIVQEPVESVTYWHVEFADHEVILAEGLSCESYLDTGNRGAFANGGAEVHMNADFARKVWHVSGCARLVTQGAEVAAARLRLLERAVALGHATTTDAALRVVVDGRDLPPGSDGRYRFPAAARQARLCSRSAVPAHVRHDSDDHRRLGVAVARIALDGKPIALTDPRLVSGWQDPEPDWRWTDGEAVMELAGERELEVEIAISEKYWVPRPASVSAVTPRQHSA